MYYLSTECLLTTSSDRPCIVSPTKFLQSLGASFHVCCTSDYAIAIDRHCNTMNYHSGSPGTQIPIIGTKVLVIMVISSFQNFSNNLTCRPHHHNIPAPPIPMFRILWAEDILDFVICCTKMIKTTSRSFLSNIKLLFGENISACVCFNLTIRILYFIESCTVLLICVRNLKIL